MGALTSSGKSYGRAFQQLLSPVNSMAIGVTSRSSEKREKSSDNSETELEFASRILREVIAPAGAAASKGERIRNAARILKWNYSRVRDIWYGDERVSLKPRELRQIEEISGVRYGRNEIDELDEIISKADALLQSAGTDFRSALAGAIREALLSLVGPGADQRDEK